MESKRYPLFKTQVFTILFVLMLFFSPFNFEQVYGAENVYTSYKTALAQDCVVHILDVGSADCIVLELPDNTKGIIDSGDLTNASRKHIVSYIQEYVFKGSGGTFDFMILTHSDADHTGGMVQIFEAFQINKVYRPTIFYYKSDATGDKLTMNNEELNRAKQSEFISEEEVSLSGNDLKTVSTNVYFDFLEAAYSEPNCEVEYTSDNILLSEDISGYEIEFYSPYKITYGNVNNFSPVMVLSYNGYSIALTGDAQSEVENYLVQKGTLPKVDALKVGHHGSSTSSTADFLSALSPTYAFISVGANDSRNPDEEVFDRLKASGVQEGNILQTGKSGDILFAIGETGIFIATQQSDFNTVGWLPVYIGVAVLGVAIVLFIVSKRGKSRNLK